MDDDYFAVTVRYADGSVVLKAIGEIDTTTRPRFETAMLEVIAGGGPSVRLDLSRVSFFGADGLNALVVAAQAATEAATRLELVAASPGVRKVLGISTVAGPLGPRLGTDTDGARWSTGPSSNGVSEPQAGTGA